MEKLIELSDFIGYDDDFGGLEDSSDSLPQVEDIIDDKEALQYLGEDAFAILADGLCSRKQVIRVKSVVMLSELFPTPATFELFRNILLDRRERAQFRFHVARFMSDAFEAERVLGLICELESSKGCNDRMAAAIMMGGQTFERVGFRLLKLLQDTNDCVASAAFLSLLRFPLFALSRSLRIFMENATVRQLKMLDKNILYYDDSFHFADMYELLQACRNTLKGGKVVLHPDYYEQSYSQEKPSKLDRYPLDDDFSSQPEEGNFSFFEL